ncbi:aldehyde dehydrogenase (NADP(+)) [Niabella insulamsoli]|uniref:aldehyde dehydrogenase (NADP(+)) n=1 Tax=Niabella insulamsoli TaxID=3144874 RepID=UPI0031FC9285
MFKDATITQIDEVMKSAQAAFRVYRKISLKERAELMRAIAREMEALGDELIRVAGEETHLPEARLRGERARTIYQLNSYADACERGDWLEARIDTAVADKAPPKPDIRKMLVPLGPVVVFGASNFPFAYSTAGGDTATALAAGCPVIVKAHPAHPQTSELVAGAIHKAVAACQLPEGVFSHVHGQSFEVGEALVNHRYTKAVGFTGSFTGGKQLFDWANQRKEPIPVFAEMSSINPVFLMPEKMAVAAAETARQYAGSITLGVGQFCTNPGLLIGVEGSDLDQFIAVLGAEVKTIAPAAMLHEGICKNYVSKRDEALKQSGVEVVAISGIEPQDNQGIPTVVAVNGDTFINNSVLHQEVFGPYSLVIKCKDIAQMTEVARHIEGQLTATLMATDEDIKNHQALVDAVQDLCGRFILNGVPTGVEVCLSMHHGGPFPSTTDARFTSVGADAIKRFARPVAYQNWSDSLLPDELKNGNPLHIWRTVNDVLSQEPVV